MNIIITGASKGIGKEVALNLAKDENNRIIAISRSETALNELQEAAESSNIYKLRGDIIELTKSPGKLLGYVQKVFNKVDILINNAGVLVNSSFENSRYEDDLLQLETNFLAPVRLIRTLIPILSSNGHVVNISSMAGFQGSSKFPGLAIYGASKAALSSVTEYLAVEFAGSGPCFNALSLGAVQTEMLATAFPGYKAPLKPEEMAEFISWFAVEGSKYFNGRNLPVTLSSPKA